ncbi:MAG TPA: glycosyltransferase [Bacteroidales bacterium]|nr:glycosyltransferase [Bacteroidales bacterium]
MFYTELSPFPYNRGERIRSYGILKALSLIGHSVTAVIGNKDNVRLENNRLENVEYIIHNYEKNMEPVKFNRYKAYFFRKRDLIRLFTQIIEDKNPSVAFIDYNYFGEFIPWFKQKGLKVIYGTHNAQALLQFQKPAASLRNKLGQVRDYLLMRFHEIVFFRQADAIISVSQMDLEYHKKFAGNVSHYVIPNFLDENLYESQEYERSNTIIMMANFLAYQNFMGLEWFIKNVWNYRLANKASFIILGFNSKIAYKVLRKKYSIPGEIMAIENVEDVKPYNQKAKVSIVPLHHGSGSRLKCLESMALRTPIVSTTKGAEGIDHDGSIHIADNPEDFRNLIINILDNEMNYTEKAFKKFIEKYSLLPNSQLFKKVIENLFL